VLWLTGLSGAGKSSIATELERELFNLGRHVYVLDGDNIRHGLGSDLGFSPKTAPKISGEWVKSRIVRRCRRDLYHCFISPYRADRELVRSLIPRTVLSKCL